VLGQSDFKDDAIATCSFMKHILQYLASFLLYFWWLSELLIQAPWGMKLAFTVRQEVDRLAQRAE
jgi:hypothetical protein